MKKQRDTQKGHKREVARKLCVMCVESSCICISGQNYLKYVKL